MASVPVSLSGEAWARAQYDAWLEAWAILWARAKRYADAGDEPRAVVMRAIAKSAKSHAADLALKVANRPEA